MIYAVFVMNITASSNLIRLYLFYRELFSVKWILVLFLHSEPDFIFGTQLSQVAR